MHKQVDGERTTIGVVDYIGTAEEQSLYRQLAALCVRGARAGLHEDADVVFEAWLQVTQEHDRWKCEHHYLIAKSHGGRPLWGIERMNAALARDPDDDLAKVGVGLAMLLGGMDGWREPIEHVLATSSDQYARRSALRTINVVAPRRRAIGRLGGNLRPS
jgi:hypothetical protein